MRRLKMFFAFLMGGGICYVGDCLVSFREHPDLPWFETGIYAGGPAGFYLSAGCIVFAFGYFFFGKDKMGAWGKEAFENDDACDWLAELEDAKHLSVVDRTLGEVLLTGGDYLEAPLASEGLAAAEVVARLQNGEKISDGIDDWVARKKIKASEDLARKAHLAIDRILGENSELRELWGEGSGYDEWARSVQELRARIRP